MALPGFPMFGGALTNGLSGLANRFSNFNPSAPTGPYGSGPSMGDRLGTFGQGLMARAQPYFADQPRPPMPQMPTVPSMPQFGGGGMPGGMPGGLPGLPPQLLQMLQARLGAASPQGWQAGTTTTPTPGQFSSPQALIASLFNRGGYQ